MKQYCVAYIGVVTILAESETEARSLFAKVAREKFEDLDNSNWAQIEEIHYVCDVGKVQ